MDVCKYYGVYIPRDSDSNESNNTDELHVYTKYEDAHRVIKEFRNSRFKCFSTEAEASYFARNGSSSGPGVPSLISESIPFKALKRQDIYKFRRHIETQDFKSVETLVWENPRYLIGIGDTPTIMQEGPRYNALHIAAMYNRPKIADFILKTVSSKTFTQLLYGAAGDNSYLVRPEVMVDMYLNTPDKGLNETPLHFAAKFGSLEVVRVFIQYPQLQLSVKNKFGQTPKDVTCKSFQAKAPHPSTDAKEIACCTKEIHKLLDEPFYVPVWRSSDDVVQPIIGAPFSPKSPPVCPMAISPLSPTMEIKAVAGPMSFDEANNFHKTWKSPKNPSSGTPHITKGLLLRNPFRGEKGLEKVGRTLARKFHVSWKEYWPFLDKFIDLASEEGLKLLEEYLHDTIVASTFEARNSSFVINSPISDLCNAFSKFTIASPEVTLNQNNEKPKCATPSPYLCMDNLCSAFGKSIMNAFRENFNKEERAEQNIAVLIKKIRNLSGAINVCSEDPVFRNFPFDKIHARVAFWMKTNIHQVDDRWLRYVTSVFCLIDTAETSEIMHCISVSPLSTKVELDSIVRTLKCVNSCVIKLIQTEVISENGSEVNKEWCSMESCACFDNNNNNIGSSSGRDLFSRLRKISSHVRKTLEFPEDEDDNELSCGDSHRTVNASEVTNDYSCDNFVKGRYTDLKICNGDSSDDEFLTPPSSASNSDDEMESPDEGPDLFIYDNKGTSMDNAVLEAIADVKIDPNQYPSIYRWKHSILLHNNMNRFSWPSPSVKQLKLKKFIADNI